MNFGRVRTVVPQPVDWPRSHRRPTYLEDDEPISFPSIAAFRDASPGRGEPLLKSPYASATQKSGVRTSTSFQQDREDPSTYWLNYWIQVPPAADAPRGTASTLHTLAVARYRLLQEEGRPVVRVALLCEDGPGACGQLRDFLMQGLPIAKPARR